MKNIHVILAALALTGTMAASAQEKSGDSLLRGYVTKLEKGDPEAVKQALPDLIARYQNHPGVIYLQARVATDGNEAAKLYQSILDNFPASEWADDALYNLYQYYYAMGLYKTADLKLQQLRKEYPQSEYLGERPAPTVSPAAADSGAKIAAPTGAHDTSSPVPRSRPPITDTVTPPAVRTAPPRTPAVESGTALPYTLQTGAFSTSENAQKQKLFFEDLGYTAEITNRVRGGRR